MGNTDVTGDVRNPAAGHEATTKLNSPFIQARINMLKRMIYHRVVLAGLMVVLN
jgi:hypothetical protein